MMEARSWRVFFLSVLVAGLVPPGFTQETAEDEEAMGSIDQMIVDAANSSREFDFFYDEGQHLLKVEYDMVYTFEEWQEIEVANGYANATERKKRTAGIINGRGGGRRWTNNVVPYQLAPHFSQRDRGVIGQAIADWERYTCLDFRQQSSGNRIYMKNGGGCYSRVGMVGGAQELGLAPGCRHKGVVIHEIGHALGLHHEQTRPDRDEHVIIVRRNIPSRMYYNFQKNTWNTILNMGIPYDYTSIMHYGKTAFSTNGQLTIQTRDPSKQNVIGNRHGLSFRDIKSVNIMYQCRKHTRGCTKTDNQCPGEGFVDKNCNCVCPGGSLRTPTKACSGGGGTRTTSRPYTTQRPRPTPRPTSRPTGCRDQNRNCNFWMRRGECNANPRYMHVYCKQSCNVCNGGTGTGTGGGRVLCRDRQSRTTCNYWRARGYCNYRYRNYVRANCMKTCGACRGNYRYTESAASCVDSDAFCPSWAASGECQRNPAYMLQSCKLSCRQCTQSASSAASGNRQAAAACTDGSTNCAWWAGRGECYRNAGYMRVVCKRSCGVCNAG